MGLKLGREIRDTWMLKWVSKTFQCPLIQSAQHIKASYLWVSFSWAPCLATSIMSVHFKVFLGNHPWVVLLFVELLSQAHISGIWRSTQGLLLGRVPCLISSSMAAILKFESIYEWGTLHSHTLAGPALMQERKKNSLAFYSGYRCELNKVFDSKKT